MSDTKPSARLFREARRRRSELESRLNALIETPLSQARAELLAPGQVETRSWKVHRAIVLGLLLQAPRTLAAQSKSDVTLASILAFSDAEIDAMVQLAIRGRQIVRLGSADPRHAMFYPSDGFFVLFARDPACAFGWTRGVAIPLSPEVAFAWISESADCDWLFKRCSEEHYLQALSLGGHGTSRVVIPPALLHGVPSSDERDRQIRRYWKEMQAHREEWERPRREYLAAVAAETCKVTEVDSLTQLFHVDHSNCSR
jgi:hypothetical protein